MKGVHVEWYGRQVLVSSLMHCRHTFSDCARLTQGVVWLLYNQTRNQTNKTKITGAFLLVLIANEWKRRAQIYLCTNIRFFFNILRTTNQFIRPSLHALKRKHISVHIRLVWWIENIQLFDSRIRNFYLRIVWINYWKYNRLLLGFTSSRCGHVCKGERA